MGRKGGEGGGMEEKGVYLFVRMYLVGIERRCRCRIRMNGMECWIDNEPDFVRTSPFGMAVSAVA